MSAIFICIICFVLPALGIWYLSQKRNIYVSFLWGMASFFVSQMVLRVPLLQLLQQSISFQLFMLQTIPYVIFLALTAGFFEETIRYLILKLLKQHQTFWDALAFGLGHGTLEAVLLVAVPLLQTGVLDGQIAVIAGIERISAMLMHLLFTLMIWKAVQTNRIYVLWAIVLHAAYDFMAIMMVYAGLSIIVCELILLGIPVLMILILIKKEREKQL